MLQHTVLIIDPDPFTDATLRIPLVEGGLSVESVNDYFLAMDKLRAKRYCAVVLELLIHHRLNGYAVLNFIEAEQPETLRRLFLLTCMTRETIARTAPGLLNRLYRKPSEWARLASDLIVICGPALRKPNHSVLLVEDDAQSARITAGLIEGLGYAVTWVQNGGEALDALFRSSFDVIMLDLIMPDVDGFTVLERLQSERPHLLGRVIVTTGIPDRYIEGLDRSRICGVLEKPLDVGQLERLLNHCASRVQLPHDPGGEFPPAAS